MRLLGPLIVLVIAAIVPFCTLDVPVLLGGPLNSPGALQLLAGALVFAGIAVSYDLLFGRVGLMSFGHALYVAVGAYGTQLAMSRLGMGLLLAAALAVLAATALAAVFGAVSLRARALGGIGFAMVTLAFAQAGSVLVSTDPGGVTGGEEGLPLDADHVPASLVGVANTAVLYWLALTYLAVCAGIVWWTCGSPLGRVWQAVRDNERRVDVLGLPARRYQLGAVVLAGALAALGGAVNLLVTAGASPGITTATFTLSLLVMVVLGGSGSRWGPILGGVIYALLDQRLAALGSVDAVHRLPPVLRVPLSQPLVLLGALFIVIVFVLPGGLAALPGRLARARRTASDQAA
ncbi:MAG TPA: branched-chain amino acid ABC transporter permease [Pseudonocardiaceae bacterium]|nr:branched-chain amino acid ABC transporter permease [Pseudonocardiaceae bacterium]